jgi:hypothetical protein
MSKSATTEFTHDSIVFFNLDLKISSQLGWGEFFEYRL